MIKLPKIAFISLPENKKGMDFFVGDIHGEFGKLQVELSARGFNKKVDRLISVGDLIDRGDNSIFAEQWLELPYFYSVRGNHEELYLNWRSLKNNREKQKQFENEIYFPNGGKWVQNSNELEHIALEKIIENLPLMITIPFEGRLIATVHAGLPDGCSWPQLIRQQLDTSAIDEMIWSRNRMLNQKGDRRSTQVWDDGIIPGLDVIVCGHVLVDKPTWAGNFLYIETGGWSSTGNFSIVSAKQIINNKYKQIQF